MSQRKATAAATGTAVANWDEELAKQAQAAAQQEANTQSGNFFSLKGGILSFNDSPMPDNQMAVIIVGGVFENLYYEYGFDPDNPSGPTCFALGRDEKEMAPHEAVVEAGTQQSETCGACPHNEWGSADKGRGKACRNIRRLALIPAGNLKQNGHFDAFEDPAHFESAAIAFFKPPVTSVKGYAAFVKQVASALQRPPHAVFAKIKVVPDSLSQFRVLFEPLAKVPNDLLAIVMRRHQEALDAIEFPYTIDVRESVPAPARGRAPAALVRRGKY